MEELVFVRKDFYIQPPEDGNPKEWLKWQKADDRKAAAHKRAVTMAQEYCETPEELQETTMRKVGGVWRQSLPIGIASGNAEEGYQAEPMVEAKQEFHIALVNMEATRNKRAGTSAAKREAQRKRRLSKRKNNKKRK